MNEKNKFFWVCVLFLFITVAVGLFVLFKTKDLAIYDWDQMVSYSESARVTLVQYHQFPLWNPFVCGGMTNIGNPQNNYLSPFFIFSLLFGSITGNKLIFVISFFIGLIGFYLLAKEYHISTGGSILASLSYMASGLIILPTVTGMIPFMSIFLVPFIIVLYMRTLKERSIRLVVIGSLFIGGLFSQIFFYGNIHFYYFMLLLCMMAFWDAVATKNIKPIYIIALCIGSFILLSAVKLFPSLAVLERNPRIIMTTEKSGYTIPILFQSLINRHQTIEWKDGTSNGILNGIPLLYGVDENGMYVGWIVLTLCMMGIFISIKHHDWKSIFLFTIFVWLALGVYAPFNLNVYLRHFPPFTYMRVMQRYRYVFMIFFVLFVGKGFDCILAILKKVVSHPKLLVIQGCIILTVGIDLFLAHRYTVNTIQFETYPQKHEEVNYSQHCAPRNTSMYPFVHNNQGIISCYEPLRIVKYSSCQEDSRYKGEIYLRSHNGNIISHSFSPNVITTQVFLQKKDRLIVNQNFSSGWFALMDYKSIIPAANTEGLLSIPIDSGKHSVSFYYLPWEFIAGFITSLAGYAGIIWLIVRWYFRSRG